MAEQNNATCNGHGSHSAIDPAILYWGTPVVLISTTNPDGATSNVAPMSSAFWLGRHCVLGLSASSQTAANLLRTGRCTLNLPDATPDMAAAVDALALTTARHPVPDYKRTKGYVHVADKWCHARLTPIAATETAAAAATTDSSSTLSSPLSSPSSMAASLPPQPPRVAECPVQMECALVASHPLFGDGTPDLAGSCLALEVKVLRTYVRDDLRLRGFANRVDPDQWRPIIMSFQHLYGLADAEIADSRLALIDEEQYRSFQKVAE